MKLLNKLPSRKLWMSLGFVTGTVVALPLFAEPVLIPKPAPLNSIGQEAGRSVAVTEQHSLMGSYKLFGGHNDSSGGAYLFANGTDQLLQTFSLGTSVDIVKPDGTPCTISSTAGALMGERVAMSDEWVALDANRLGVQVSPEDPTGTCGEPVPTVFLAKKNASGPEPYGDLSYTIPAPGQVQGLAVSDDALAMVTNYGTYTYRFDGTEWILNGMIWGASSSPYYKAPLAMDGNRIILGDPDNLKLRLFEKNGNGWAGTAVYSGYGTGFGKAVDISGNDIITTSDNATEFFRIDSQGAIKFIQRDFSFPGSSVAISGRNAITGGGSELNKTKFYYKNGPNWFSAGHIEGVDDMAPANNNPWAPYDIDLSGSATLAGWIGYNSPDGHQLIGSIVYDTFPGPFAVVPLTDNAEHEQVWENVGQHQWQKGSGSTPSAGTGPSGGADGSQHYYYVETSLGGAHFSGNTAIFQTDLFDPSEKVLDFDYHLYGDDIGSLYIDVYFDGSWLNEMWSSGGGVGSGNPTPSWDHATFQLSNFAGLGEVRLRFRYVAAGGWKGDAAIDNIVISQQ